MAKLICEKEPDFDHPFAPERKLLSTLPNKKTAINNVVQHYMAGFYEHGMELARLFPARNMEQLLTTKFEKIYEMLDTEYPLVPDILFLFELSDANDKNIAYFKQYFKNQTFIATDFK